jgi:hypothetical protein
LFDKFKISRAELAYIIDSTSAPICILILLNGWGAYILGLLGTYQLNENSIIYLNNFIHLKTLKLSNVYLGNFESKIKFQNKINYRNNRKIRIGKKTKTNYF